MLDLSNRFTFEANRIAWGTLGEGDPLVLLHGTPFSSQVWRRIAPWLARHRRVFFYDLLGYGQSDKPNEDVSLGRQNKLLVALLHEWGSIVPRCSPTTSAGPQHSARISWMASPIPD